jgi:hypothetical protein
MLHEAYANHNGLDLVCEPDVCGLGLAVGSPGL